eukprot:1141188-Pelagomonas_calceolata.AAC.1
MERFVACFHGPPHVLRNLTLKSSPCWCWGQSSRFAMKHARLHSSLPRSALAMRHACSVCHVACS